jgi:hypothetical protein
MTQIVNIIIEQRQATRLQCPECGAHLDIALPVALGEWLAVAENFNKRHNRCSRANIEGESKNARIRTP